MKCISEELIQKYIDKETSPTEDEYILVHSGECRKCADEIVSMRQSADRIKNLIRLSDEEDVEIPGFVKPVQIKKISNKNYKRIIYAASAACILFLFLFLFQTQEDDAEYIYSYDLEIDFNANLPASEQEMVIQIIDSEGKLIDHHLE